jgi:hypothetical protein
VRSISRARLVRSPSTALAVEALGRRTISIPRLDTIVRVTAHQLRKRLQEIYAAPAPHAPLQVHIPAGQYAPSFVIKKTSLPKLPSSGLEPRFRFLHPLKKLAVKPGAVRRPMADIRICTGVIVLLGGVLFEVMHTRVHSTAGAAPDFKPSGVVEGHPVRALLGKGRGPTSIAREIPGRQGITARAATTFPNQANGLQARKTRLFFLAEFAATLIASFPSILESMKCICFLQRLPTCPRPQAALNFL